MRSPIRSAITLILVAIALGCSGSSDAPVVPDDQYLTGNSSLGLGHFVISFDETTNTLKVDPVSASDREAEIDVTQWAEFGIDSVEWDPVTRNWTLDCWLKNSTILTGYGVWIVFSEMGEKKLVGQDGFAWIPSDIGPMIRVPFLAVGKDQPLRAFSSMHSEDVEVVIHWPEGVTKWIPLEFYIDASWPDERVTPMVENLNAWQVSAEATSYITAWVADFQDSGETLDVFADLTPIGGGQHVLLFDDGLHEDGDADDSVFGVEFSPDCPSGDYTVTLYALDPSDNRMENDVEYTFTEPGEPWIEVLVPNGGEVWEVGTDQEVTWASEGITSLVSIFYSKDNFVSDFHLVSTDEPNDGSYMWEGIPDDPSTTARVRVITVDDPVILDDSDEDFTIFKPPWIQVISPDGGEDWEIGSKHSIMWDSGDVSGTVFIEYSKDDFVADINTIVLDEPNDGGYLWNGIPDDPSETVKMRISSTDDPDVCDVSDGYFTISGSGDPCRDWVWLREGTHCNIDWPVEHVIRTEAEWEDFLATYWQWPNPPTIDFETEMVLAIFMGDFSHSGYWAEINDICLDDSDVLHVDYTSWYPAPGCPVLWVFVQPYLIVKTETYDGEVVFDTVWTPDPC